MKIISVMGLILAASFSVQAMSGKTPPSNNGSGAIQCAWYDSGKKEEHGPHASQQECLASGHSSCQERCFDYVQECTVSGVIREISKDKDGKIVHSEHSTTFTARDKDMYRAREEARYRCETSYPRQEYCRIESCHEVAERVK